MPKTDRYSLFLSACNGEYELVGNPKDADCIMAFAMGYAVRGGAAVPGGGNEALAEYIFANFVDLPVLAQAEVAEPLKALGYKGLIMPFGQVGVRISTRAVAMLMLAEMCDPLREYENPLIVASKYHVGRVVAILVKLPTSLRLNLIVPSGLPTAFSFDSAQHWTRKLIWWVTKEPFVWLHHLRHHWI